MVRDAEHLQIIAVRRLDDSDSRYTLISPADIAFIFVGSALHKGFVPCRAVFSEAVRSDRLYLRTGKGVYGTSYRSLRNLCNRLSPESFFPIQRSLAINIRNAREVDFREKQIGITITDGALIWLDVSRRYIRALRQRILLPAKVTGKH
jgi:hypothetical protein